MAKEACSCFFSNYPQLPDFAPNILKADPSAWKSAHYESSKD